MQSISCPDHPPGLLWSKRIYLKIKRNDIAFFKLLLESYDNLAYMTVVDKWESVIQLNFLIPDQERVEEFLQNMSQEISLVKLYEDKLC